MKSVRILIALIGIAILVGGCVYSPVSWDSSYNEKSQPDQNNDVAPYNPSPATGTIVNDTVVTLSWACNMINGRENKYDIYIGPDTSSLAKVDSNLTVRQCRLNNLQHRRLYYWQVVVTNYTGQYQSPIWKFRVN